MPEKSSASKLISSPYRSAKEVIRKRVEIWHLTKDMCLVALGVFSAAFGLLGFLIPNFLIDGGVTGISLLLFEITKIELSVLIVVINLPFIFMGYKQLGKAFAIKSIIAIFTLAIILYLFHGVGYDVTKDDKVLAATFGGFFLGVGIGLTVRGGAVLDGTEILAIFLSKKTGLSIGDIIMVFNVLVFSVALVFLDREAVLYSILTYLAASKTVDFVIEGVEEYTGVTIISSHSDEIRLMIIGQMGRGVTLYSGKRGFGKRGDSPSEIDIVFTVITRLEVARLQAEIAKIDPDAFIIMSSIKDTKGGMIKKRPFKE